MNSRVPFVSTSIDFLCVGGFSIVVFAGFAFANYFGIKPNPILLSTIAGTISWFINWPHFSATLHRLYGDANSRAEFPHTVYLSPVIAIGGFFAGLLSPMDFAPLWAKTFFLWSGYHFSAQSLGFSLLYARRDGVHLKFWEHRLFSVFCFAPFLFLNLVAETRTSNSTYFGVPIYSLRLPPIIQPILDNAMVAITVLFVLSVIFLRRRLGRWPHLFVILPLISQFCWFWLTRNNPGYSEFVPAFHSLQYLLIAWYMNAFSFRESPKLVLKRTGTWIVVNIAGGAFLFFVLPRFLSQTVLGGGISKDFVFGMCLACVQIQHFFVDGVIWKLKYEKATLPLLQSWSSPHAHS